VTDVARRPFFLGFPGMNGEGVDTCQGMGGGGRRYVGGVAEPPIPGRFDITILDIAAEPEGEFTIDSFMALSACFGRGCGSQGKGHGRR